MRLQERLGKNSEAVNEEMINLPIPEHMKAPDIERKTNQ